MSLHEFTENYIKSLSTGFYVAQVATIIMLLLYGFVLMLVIRKNELSIMDLLLCMPISLAIYMISGYFLLSVGISFNRTTQLMMMFFILIVIVLLNVKKLTAIGVLFSDKGKRKMLAVYGAVCIVLAFIVTSGCIPVSVTNDSMYFFSEYPRALIYYGKLTSILDNFLTDASQGIAVLGTIPFFFGFDEMFGIQAFLNIDFIVIFTYAVYDYAINSERAGLDEKTARIMSIVALLLLETSLPFILMSRWFMANMFFMEYMFIVLYLAYKYERSANYYDLFILSVLITGLSIMRMEGALNAGLLVLCIMMLGYKNVDVVRFMIIPMLVLQGMYLFRIFIVLTLHTDIQFMTKEKAIILMVFLIVIAIYALFIRGRRLTKLLKYYPYILVLGLVMINVVVLLYDSRDYITNLFAFARNLTKNSGWGLFVSLIIGVCIIIPKKSININFFDISVICYILVTIVAAWARGDNLYESFGDSGNRIMIQVVPILLYAVIVKVLEGISFWRKENLS